MTPTPAPVQLTPVTRAPSKPRKPKPIHPWPFQTLSQPVSNPAPTPYVPPTAPPHPAFIGSTPQIIARHTPTARQRQLVLSRGRSWSARYAPSPRLNPRRPFIAIDTQLNSLSSLAAQRAVMLFDTRGQKVIGKYVYDLATPPTLGAIVRFDKFSAQYIGAGY